MAKTATKTVRAAPKPGPAPPNPTEDAEERPDSQIEMQEGEPSAIPTFFQQVKAIAQADWGARANIYLYRTEPVIDRTRAGGPKFVECYAEPIDETRIMVDHGSGRYKLLLNFRKPGAKQGDERDSLYIQILNTKYPPKIAPGEWVDDPKNKKWAWAKTPETPAQTGQASIVEAFQTFTAIEDQLRTRMQPDSKKSPAEELQTLMGVVQQAAKLQQPAETGLGDFFRDELKAMRAEVAASRERGDKLMEKLIEAGKSERKENGMGAVKELIIGLKELMPEAKSIFPDLAERVARSRMSGWQEFFQPALPAVLELLKPLAAGIGQAQMIKAHQAAQPMRPNPPIQTGPVPNLHTPTQPVNGAPNPTGPTGEPASGTEPAGVVEFLQDVTPLMLHYLRKSIQTADERWSGSEFAALVADQYGEQWIKTARTAGAENIVTAYKGSPVWPQLVQVEPAFRAFLETFIGWEPDEADEKPGLPDEPASDSPIEFS